MALGEVCRTADPPVGSAACQRTVRDQRVYAHCPTPLQPRTIKLSALSTGSSLADSRTIDSSPISIHTVSSLGAEVVPLRPLPSTAIAYA